MDDTGEVLGKPSDRSVETFTNTAWALKSHPDLTAKAAKGDKDAASSLLLADLYLSKVKFEEAKTRLEALKDLPADRKKIIEVAMLDLEIKSIFENAGTGEDAREIVGTKLLAMKKAGRIPTSGMAQRFWGTLMGHAENTKNADLFEEGAKHLKKILGDNPRFERLWKRVDATLKKLRENG